GTLSENVISGLKCNGNGAAPETAADASAGLEEDETGGMHFRRAEESKELKTTPNLGDSSANDKKVRFLTPIGEIVGPDLKIYGPYDEGVVISLPNDLARVLVEKKQAEEVLN
ncbi:hypothetical protein KY349_04655, partial [Candidatus Woesearchaeota archaeon]|nr:hypothetical protein [Candidatus Woesearchaeota archaeon]